ncbi:MAG: hypothetical protein AAFX06_21785 [Planctomycetota bacterium]
MATQQKAVRVHGEPIGRSLRKRYTNASKPSWEETGRHFHHQHRKRRFTHRHATEAGFQKRSPLYLRMKFRKYGHTYPLKKTGEAEAQSRTARVTARGGTGQLKAQGGVKVLYKIRKFNFRPSGINLRDEFTRVTDREARQLGNYWGARFGPRFSNGA